MVRDTDRNLRLFAFVVGMQRGSATRTSSTGIRPYVIMMNTRGQAAQDLGHNDHVAALAQIDGGIAKIRAFLPEYGQSEQEAECFELGFLLRFRREVEEERPVGPLQRLEQQLELAVSLEEYEEAARIRDQLQRLRDAGVGQGASRADFKGIP